jgi:hypothetical protein
MPKAMIKTTNLEKKPPKRKEFGGAKRKSGE